MDDLERWADDPMWDNEPTRYRYALPLGLSHEEASRQGKSLKAGIPEDELYHVAHYLCAKSPQSHRAAFKHAIDFLVLDGTQVFAAESGVVVEVQETSDEWGADSAYRDLLNYITIQHAPNEFGQYCHLAQYSVRDAGIRKGATVHRGQVIGTVGKTGWTDRDHLHFIVFRGFQNPSPFQFKSLVPQWIDQDVERRQ